MIKLIKKIKSILINLNFSGEGFTFIEVLIVVSIISILASGIIWQVSKIRMRARDAQRMSDLQKIGDALDKYYADHGYYAPDLPGRPDLAGVDVGGLGNNFYATDSFASGENYQEDSPIWNYNANPKYNYLAWNFRAQGPPEFLIPNYIDIIPKDPKPNYNDEYGGGVNSIGHHYTYRIYKNKYYIRVFLENRVKKPNGGIDPAATDQEDWFKTQIFCPGDSSMTGLILADCLADPIALKKNKVYAVGNYK